MKSLLERMKNSTLEERVAARRKSGGGAASQTPPAAAQAEGAVPASQSATRSAGDVLRQEHAASQQDRDALVLLLEQIDVEDNVRTRYPDAEIRELAADIAANGQYSAVVVERLPDGRYRLLQGARRYRAKRLLQKSDPVNHATIRATVRGEVSDPKQRRWLQLSENIQREDLNPMDEARAIAANMEGLTHEQAAGRLNKPQSWVSRRLSLLELDPDVQRQIELGELGIMEALKRARKAMVAGSAAGEAAASEGEADRAPPPAPIERVQRVPVPLNQLIQICELYAALAKRHNLAEIRLSTKPSRKELLTIIEQRTSEMRSLFDAAQ